MKTSKLFSILVLILLTYSCKNKTPANADHTYEAIEDTYSVELRKGLNKITNAKSGGVALELRIVKGEKPEYVITENGKVIPSELITETVAKATTCWRCATDGAGDMHCFIIACPKDLTPIGNAELASGNFKLSRQ